MEKKNKKLIILVSILLVGIGVSLAYFVGTSMFEGVGSKVEGVASSINGAILNVEGILEFNDLDILPGHQTISSVKVTATGNNELIPYNLIWKGTNTFNTPLEFKVYKTTERKEVSINCEKKTKIENGAQILNEECTTKNIEQLGSIIASGTINKEETKATLATEEFITATSDGATVYYYIILEYPNLEEEQNEDMGGTFNGQVTVEGSNAKPDINILAAYIKQKDGTYKETSEIPTTGYTIDEEKSVCSNGATVAWDYIHKGILTTNLTKNGTSCYLYFDASTSAQILSNISKINEETPNFSQEAITDEGVFKTKDDDGDTYYWRGAVTNNYIKFANKYWRIIRINGDGSVRIIYDGETARANNTVLTLNTGVFNEFETDNMYVGFKYTSGEVHGIGTESTIMQNLNTWYTNNLVNYTSKIDQNAGFCGDRTPSSGAGGINNLGGTGTTTTYYGAYIRLITFKTPSLQCSNEDNYTVIKAIKGNKSLTYPIGLITADEASLAGMVVSKTNSQYYLYTNNSYWTISPFNYGIYHSTVGFIDNFGRLGGGAVVNQSHGIRPVINLRSDIELTGTGTIYDPYVVVDGN